MDMIYSIACVSSSDGMDDDALSSNLPRPFLKASAAAIAAASIGVVPGGGRGASGAGTAGGIPGPLIPPATSVHELLECPVCTNSMYPPIHQVLQVIETHFEQRIIRDIKFYLRSWVCESELGDFE